MTPKPKRAPGLDTGLNAGLLRPSGAILAAHVALCAAIDREAVTGTGLDPTTLDLLVRLGLAPDRRLRAVDLCCQLQLSPSHISRMLDRAETAGLVIREPDPDDRRAKSAVITEEGHAVVTYFAPRLHDVLNRAVHNVLEPDEIEALVGYLERIAAAAKGCATDAD